MSQISERDGHSSENQPLLGAWIIEGNRIADELAWQGTTADILRDKDTVGMPMATCKLFLMQRLYTLSNNRWNTISTCHNSRLTWPNYNPEKTQNSPTIQRGRHFHSYKCPHGSLSFRDSRA